MEQAIIAIAKLGEAEAKRQRLFADVIAELSWMRQRLREISLEVFKD